MQLEPEHQEGELTLCFGIVLNPNQMQRRAGAMLKGLFREEALEAKRTHWLGSISLAQPPAHWLITLFILAVASLVIIFFCSASYTRRERVSGQLVPSSGLISVNSTINGVLGDLGIEEGSAVHKGQILASINASSATSTSGDTISSLQESVGEKENGLIAAESGERSRLMSELAGLQTQLMAARREHANLLKEIDTQEQQVALARDVQDRFIKADSARIISTIQARQQESTALAQQSQLQLLQRQLIVVERLISQLQQQVAAIPGQIQTMRANYQRELAAVKQERTETAIRGALQVSSSADGLVATQLVKPGQAVKQGQPLFVILPNDSPLLVELFLPSRAIGFVSVGDAVLLRYDAFPYQKFGQYEGKVVRISRNALSPDDLGDVGSRSEGARSLYRVVVEPKDQFVLAYGRSEPLRPSMLVDAEIMGEKRRLYEWVFEPIYSLTGG